MLVKSSLWAWIAYSKASHYIYNNNNCSIQKQAPKLVWNSKAYIMLSLTDLIHTTVVSYKNNKHIQVKSTYCHIQEHQCFNGFPVRSLSLPPTTLTPQLGQVSTVTVLKWASSLPFPTTPCILWQWEKKTAGTVFPHTAISCYTLVL